MNYLNEYLNLNFYIVNNDLTFKEKVNVFISGVVGIVVGLMTSIVVNITLTEISINPFFTIYFGLIFITLGILMIVSIRNNQSYIIKERKNFIFKFAIMIVISGVSSFLLEKDFIRSLNYKLKIPIYTIVGVSISFSVVFIILDFINYLISLIQHQYDKQIIESKLQIYLILGMSIIMGAVYGFIFGLLDFQDDKNQQISSFIKKDEFYCIPFGILLGGIGGILNELIRIKASEIPYLPIKFDDEI